jgi:flagellar hook-basal body protein
MDHMNGRRLGSAALLLVAACNAAPRDDSGTTGTTIDNAVAGDERGPALNIVTPFGADGRCAEGGQELQSGFDDDGDGLLGAGELTATTVLCGAVDGGVPGVSPPSTDEGPCGEGPGTLAAPALALNVEGPGYFVLAGGDEGTRYYARALDVHVDDTGQLREAHGLLLLGQSAADGALTPLDAAPPVRTARATSSLTLALNLASDMALSPPWTGGSPRGESSFSTELVVFDSGGAARPVDLYFARTAARTFVWHAVIDASELADPGGYETGTGELVFDEQGRLSTGDVAALDVSFLGAAPNQRLRIDFAGSTSLPRPSALTTSRQDGHAVGVIEGYGVSADGEVRVSYASGSPRSLGRLVLATLQPDAAVVRACQGLWLSQGTAPAGVALGAPGAGAWGRVVAASFAGGASER